MTEAITPFHATPLAQNASDEDQDAIDGAHELAAALERHKALGRPPIPPQESRAPYSHVLAGEIFSLALRTMSFPGEDRPVRFEFGPERSRISVTNGDTVFWVDFDGAPGQVAFAFEGRFGPLHRLGKLWHRNRWAKHLRLDLYPDEELLRICSGTSDLGLAARLLPEPPQRVESDAARTAKVDPGLLARALNLCCMFSAKEDRDDKLISIVDGRATAGKMRGACIIDAPDLAGITMTITQTTAKRVIASLRRLGGSGLVTWHDCGAFQMIRDDHCGLTFPVQPIAPQNVSALLSSERLLVAQVAWLDLFERAQAASIPAFKADAGATTFVKDDQLTLQVNTDRGSAIATLPIQVVQLAAQKAANDPGQREVLGPSINIEDLCASISAFQSDLPLHLTWALARKRVAAMTLEARQKDYHVTVVLPALA